MTKPKRCGNVAVLTVAMASGFAGCMPIKVWEVHPEPANRAVRSFLGEQPFGRPDSGLHVAGGPQCTDDPDPVLLEALTSFDDASDVSLWSRNFALGRYLDAMSFASKVIFDTLEENQGTPPDPRQSAALSVYNRSLEGFLRLAGGHQFLPDESWRARLARCGIMVDLRRDEAVWPPERFDELRFAGDFVVRGMPHYYGSSGIGVPLIAIRKPTSLELDRRLGADRFYPYWEVNPCTDVLLFERKELAANSRATLELRTRHESRMSIWGTFDLV